MRGLNAKWIAALAVVWGLWGATEREAAAQPALDTAVIVGVDGDLTAIGRLLAGGIWQFGQFAPEAHIGFDGFLPIDSDAGITARSISLINVGARYAFLDDNFVGPFVTAGGGFGLFTGKPHERQLSDAEVCSAARPPSENCAYLIDKNINGRLGFGWGFETSSQTTVAARLDVHYWMFSLNDFEDQPNGAPIPNMVERPQATWSVLIGLEFMHWPK